MGEPLNRRIKSDSNTAGVGIGETNHGNSGSSSTGAETGTAGSSGATAGKTEETRVPKLVVLDNPNPNASAADKKEQRRIKDRERYARKKQESSGVKATAQPEVLDPNQINIILLTVSAIIASRPGMEVWMLSESEVKQISAPLGNILAKSDAFAGAGQYADHIALVIACMTVFIPRLMVTVQKSKAKEVKKNAVKVVDTGNKAATVEKPVGKDDGKHPGNDTSNSKLISSLIPSLT